MSLKTIRYRAEWLCVRSLEILLPLFPRWYLHFLAKICGAVASFVHWPGRRVARINLAHALPELPSAERGRLVRESYQQFARAMADLFWSPRLTREGLEQIFELEDLRRLQRERGIEGGCIFACLHYGGFEWIALALGLSGVQATVVTQPFKNPYLNAIFNRLRAVAGHKTIRRAGALLRLYKALQNQQSVILAVDLTVSAKLPSVPITCFGMQTCVTIAHAWLHQRTGAPIIPTHCEPLPGGRYRLVLRPPLQIAPDATHQEVAQACWDCFEPVIRRNPAPWLWMYKHWRYLPPDSARPYPEYANQSPHFRQLLARMEREKAKLQANVVAL